MTVRRAHLFVILAVIGAPRLAPADDAPAADTAAGITFFEVEDPAGPRRALLQVPLGRARASRRGTCCSTPGRRSGPAATAARPSCPATPTRASCSTAVSHADPDLKMPPKKERLAGVRDRRHQDVDPDGGRGPSRGRGDRRSPPAGRHRGRPPVLGLPEARRPRAAGHEGSRLGQARPRPLHPGEAGAAGLAPSADAEPATLLRRLHFDLVGLPPSPEAVERFLERVEADGLDAALEPEVDALLASPQFGERWGRHWLDVARFAESSGKEANISFPYAWRYRDYVIDAFNADMPFDRFLLEQIAGDLLPSDERRRAGPAADRHRVPGGRAQEPRRSEQGPVRGRPRRRADRRRDARRCWPTRWPAPAATTTSSTRSRWRTTTPWPASSPAPRPTSAPSSRRPTGSAATRWSCRAGPASRSCTSRSRRSSVAELKAELAALKDGEGRRP